jgi:hypothetical protein
MLRPVMKFCLRHSIRIQDVLESCKVVMLQLAEEQMEAGAAKTSLSRLSVMTGIHRRDVMRIHKEGLPKNQPFNFITKIIGQWQSDREFTTTNGRARTLSYKGNESEFAKLVGKVSRDLKPHTVLFELQRTGSVELRSSGVRLKRAVFSPGKDLADGARMMAAHTEQLMSAIEENLADTDAMPNFHLVTAYDDVVAEAAPHIREWILREGSKLHKRARDYLSQFDREINPALKHKDGGIRVLLGGFSRIEKPHHS